MPRKKIEKQDEKTSSIEKVEKVKEEEIEEKESKIEKIKEKAKKLEEKIDKTQTKKELKEKIEDSYKELTGELPEERKIKKKEIKRLTEEELKKVMTDTKETLVPLTDYIRCSVHLGTKVITPDMKKYVYKRRADGLAVINTNLIDDKLRKAIEIFNKYEPKEVFVACKREAGWKAVEKFSEVTGIRKFTKKYPAGIITNLRLDSFFEARLALICDPWVDKNALNDAGKVDMTVLAVCDTNNYTQGVTERIVGNNKSGKSIGLILYILAREYLRAHEKEDEAKALTIEDFTGKLDDSEEE